MSELVSLILLPPQIIVSCCSIDTVVKNGLDIIQLPLNLNYYQSISLSWLIYANFITNLRNKYFRKIHANLANLFDEIIIFMLFRYS